MGFATGDPTATLQADPPPRHAMLVFAVDLPQIDPRFAGASPFFFYDLDGDALTEPAGFVAYAPARDSEEGTQWLPQRIHAWSGAVHSGENILDATRALHRALELGFSSLEIVVYTARPVHLLADANLNSRGGNSVLPSPPAILVVPPNALQSLADDEPRAAEEEGAAAGGTCRSCSNGGITLSAYPNNPMALPMIRANAR